MFGKFLEKTMELVKNSIANWMEFRFRIIFVFFHNVNLHVYTKDKYKQTLWVIGDS